MRKNQCVFILIALLSITLMHASHGAAIRGVVKDTLTNTPIDSVLVQIKGAANQVYTDTAGRFSLSTSAVISRPVSGWNATASLSSIRIWSINGDLRVQKDQPANLAALNSLPAGVYCLETRQAGGTRYGRILAIDRNHKIPGNDCNQINGFSYGALRKNAAAVMLVYSHRYYTGKEASANEGDTNVTAELAMWFPDSSTTGVPAGTVLANSAGIRVDVDGTIIENKNVAGNIDIYAKNVIVRNCKIQAHGDYWGVQARSSGVSVINCTIDGTKDGGSGQGVKQISGDTMIIRGCDISNFADGIMIDVGIIEDNYIHDLSCDSTAHYDGIQNGGGGPCVIRHNAILNANGNTSCIALFQDFGIPHDVLAEFNFMAGAGYTVYGGAGSRGTPSNIKFLRNRFSKMYYPDCGYWGYLAYGATWGSNGNEWSGNVWDSTGAAVAP